MDKPKEMTQDEALSMIKEKFHGREIVLDQQTAEQMRFEQVAICSKEAPGCGQRKPLNHFYKNIPGYCIECCQRSAESYGIGLEIVGLVFNGYEVTRQIINEAKVYATKEDYDAGIDPERGRRHFISSLIKGAVENPRDLQYFLDLRDRYRGWIFSQYKIPASAYKTVEKAKTDSKDR